MKRYVPIALILIILFQSSIRAIIIIHFQLNKDYIVKNLCENKDNPEKHCNGKCYLLKSIKKQERHEQQSASLMKEIKEIILFFSIDRFLFSYDSYAVTNKLYDHYLMKYYTPPISDIFQPPQ